MGHDPPPVRYVRRHVRAAVQCPVTVIPAGSERALPGEALDLSACGAGLVIVGALPPLTPVAVELDLSGLADGALPRLAGEIRSARRAGQAETGEALSRVGVMFSALPPRLRRQLGEITRRILGVASPLGDAGGDASQLLMGPALSASPRGREMLFQAAYERLDDGQFASARELALWAVRGDGQVPHYQALVHRANAEEALAAGQPETALNELALAVQLTPADDDLGRLRARIDASTASFKRATREQRSYLSKLFKPR